MGSCDEDEWDRCDNCGLMGVRQQTVLGDLPLLLVVHVNKPGLVACLSAEHDLAETVPKCLEMLGFQQPESSGTP